MLADSIRDKAIKARLANTNYFINKSILPQIKNVGNQGYLKTFIESPNYPIDEDFLFDQIKNIYGYQIVRQNKYDYSDSACWYIVEWS